VEAKLRGPHPFPLERLLHVFYALYAAHNAGEEDQGSGDQDTVGGGLAVGSRARAC
jgi:hypothetical protein